MMTNSHFFKRGLWGTRWDFDNQDAMCTFCHSAIENHKTDWIEGFNYQEFMVAKIGVSGLEALRIKSEREMHFKEWELKKIEAEMKITLERLLDYQGDSRLIHK